MVTLFRDDFGDGRVITFANGEPITGAHFINEPSYPHEDIRELLLIAEPLLTDEQAAIDAMREADPELSNEDAKWLLDNKDTLKKNYEKCQGNWFDPIDKGF